MLKKIFNYFFGSFLEEFRKDLKTEIQAERVGVSQIEASLGKIFANLASEQDIAIRRDMVREMQRVGQAFMSTAHQITMLQHEITLLKLGTPVPEPKAELRTPGTVDWFPHPAHFGNKIDI
jgi:hypothetical protein